ncbi:MAG TPA: ParB/RepB/Spo0J family partition protein [Candidatus Merdibacter merdavium]|uniref:ParB/RepB/Spo0J family partition protein n=1 Tax=Candidatus Merdibacter merdavium TaxID=2838692 RepID=A0A9D2NR38_9FIRM|nr:ParB/RepB/Spo0J family partition protein [Candidatus Merdibacter merdavium]
MAKKSEARLGKGLAAIFGEDVSDVLEDIQQGKSDTHVSGRFEVAVDDVRPNPYQPRKTFDKARLQELADSIRQHGVFTPILVKRSLGGYELIAGERRLRACRIAGLKKIPAIEMEFDDQQMMEIALLENIQREDLNAIEEAKAYEKLIQKVGYTQEELARRIGKSREHVANMMRLLKLPARLQQHVTAHELSMGHVRALLSLEDETMMEEVAQKAIREQLSVRAVEKLVKSMVQPKPKKKEKPRDIHLEAVEHRLQDRFQTTVKVANGQIVIRYSGDDDLNRILEMIGGLDESI